MQARRNTKRNAKTQSIRRNRTSHPSRRLGIESLEARRLLTTNPLLIVTAANGTGPGTLADRIQIANSRAGADRIVFDPSIQEIQPFAELLITDALTIDGENRVFINGTGSPRHGLIATANHVEFSQLTVGNYTNGFGVIFSGVSSGWLHSSKIGTNLNGDSAKPNHAGVLITSSSNVIIGADSSGGTTKLGNLISGNNDWGVILDANSNNNRLSGNRIGTNASGQAPLPNAYGVGLWGKASHNIIGTNGDGVEDQSEGNLISGNFGQGVNIDLPGTDYNVIAGNFIGTNANADSALPNGNWTNIYIGANITGTRIGTDGNGIADTAERNIISGSAGHGMVICGTSSKVAGNYIGLDRTGTRPIPNAYNGISLDLDAKYNVIGIDGNASPGESNERNIISGNTDWGVFIYGTKAHENRISGNIIGADAAGLAALPNRHGVGIVDGSSKNIIGTNGDGQGDSLEGNLISGNLQLAVYLLGAGTVDNVIAGNTIGLDATSNLSLPNHGWAAVIVDNQAHNNRIGTDGNGISDATETNTIAGNIEHGIAITSSNNTVAGNFVGTNRNGTPGLGNNGTGVLLYGNAQFNIIGTNGDASPGDAAERNIIAANRWTNIEIHSPNVKFNRVAGNLIGTNPQGTEAYPNTTVVGILAHSNASDNVIGTNGDGIQDALEGNVISGASEDGIGLHNTFRNRVAGNRIGTDISGNFPIPNKTRGILVTLGAQDNIIGVDGDQSPGEIYEGNLISGNSDFGILFDRPNTINNRLAGNKIGTTLSGLAALPNYGGVAAWGQASNNIIGTNGDGAGDALEGNLISGNLQHALYLNQTGTDHNAIAGNWIGVDATGNQKLANGAWAAIFVETTPTGTRIGTNGDGVSDSLERNIISGNFGHGIAIRSSNTKIAGNYIGTNRDGNAIIANGTNGVVIFDGGKNNVIGVDGDASPGEASEGNLISGNAQWGVRIQNVGTSFNRVAGNRIGTDANGLLPLPNLRGVYLWSGASENIIGTNSDGISDSLEKNLISGNQGYSLYIQSSGTNNNVIAGNWFGVDATGNAPLKNGERANIVVDRGALFNRIGTNGDAIHDLVEQNVISGNNSHGITVVADSTRISGNLIGTNANGTAAIPNGKSGIELLNGAKLVTIGSDGDASSGEANEGNLISGNKEHGVLVTSSSQIRIAGNKIGTNFNGSSAIPNLLTGIRLVDSSLITIGSNNDGSPEDASEGNLISGNIGPGIEITGSTSTNNSISRNTIANNSTGIRLDLPATSLSDIRFNQFSGNSIVAIDIGPEGPTPNDLNDLDQFTNAPVITNAQLNNNTLIIEGFARPGAQFDLYKTQNYSNGFGQGEIFLVSLAEGSPQDADTSTGSYDPNSVGGTPVGIDQTNRFRFVIPINALANPIESGNWITSVNVAPTSEFGNATQVLSPIVIPGTNGNDAFTVTQTNPNSWSIRRGTTSLYTGPISPNSEILIQGGNGTDTLTVNGSSVADTFIIGNDSITLNDIAIRHFSVESRTANGLGQNDTFFINSSIESLKGGDGLDRFVFADSELTVELLEGGNGYDTLDYANRNTSMSYSVGATNAPSITRFSTIESIVGSSASDDLRGRDIPTYWGITGENTTQINNIDYVGFENLYGGTSTDFFQFWNPNSRISGKISGGEGTNRITAFNRNNTWILDADKRGAIADQVPLFEGIEILIGGTQNDTFRVNPLARFTSIDAGTGNDSIDFSNFNASVTLSLATQSVTATGRFTSVENFIGSSRQDAITAANSANLWHLTGPSIGSINNLNFASFEVLRGGSGADQFNIGNEGSVSQIVGGNGIDTVRGPDIANSWRITQASRGTLNSQTNFQDIEHIVGGNLDDAVEMLPTGRITGSLSGGAGTNSLSYRNVTTSVAVNASPGVATYITSLAPNFQILIGGSGNDNLRAFPGIPSVLVGNAGNDTLIGSSQNDILIGGIGNDTLRGGSGQDILIAATTSHDAAPLALANLRAEWTSEQSYTQRIENLQGTSSSNNPLNNGTYLRNSPTDTLFDDSTLDSLYGDEDLDWFIANLSVDLLADRVADEWTTNPSGS
jgi:parallel beta-helix repeat protein